jgi:N-acetylglucosamine malate deacetylase 1
MAGERFAYLGGVEEGQQVLRALLQGGWRPALILALENEVLASLSGGHPWLSQDWDHIPLVKVSSFQSPQAMLALGEAHCQGVLAVGLSEILRAAFLDAFPLGVYGFHASLLPELAGPAPVNWAILKALSRTGSSLLRFSTEVDGGTLVGQAESSIDARETCGTLYAKLNRLSARLWMEHWPRVAAGRIPVCCLGRLAQNLRRRPEDGLLRWDQATRESVDCQVRALSDPYPGAYFWVQRRRIWVHRSELVEGHGAESPVLSDVGDGVLDLSLPGGRLRLSDLRTDDGLPPGETVVAQMRGGVGHSMAALHRGRRVLAIVAHPDDEVLGVGGTLARHFKEGDEVHVRIVSSGDPIRYADGQHDQPGDAQRAAYYLGAETAGLKFPDQRLDAGSNLGLIQAVESEVQRVQPQTIYTHHWGDVNADHVRIAEAVDVAVRPFSAPFVESVLAFETASSSEWTVSARHRSFSPNVFVDITGEMARKLDAMRAYRSELRPYPHPRSLRSLKERAGFWGSVANFEAAEAFMLLRGRTLP